MARRLILDTGVLVTKERQHFTTPELISSADDVVIAAITVAELRTGIELAGERHRPMRMEFLGNVMRTFPVESYDLATAEAHGRLLAHVHRTGTTRGAHDLVIAATAITTNRTLLTADRAARFDELPGLDCVVLS